MAKKRIGILTGGGDVPGLNSVLKTVTYRGSDDGIDVIGLRLGWEGLTHLDCNDPASMRRYVMPLDRANTRIIDRRGGTMLHSSRTNPSNIRKLPAHLEGKDLRWRSKTRAAPPRRPPLVLPLVLGTSRSRCWQISAGLASTI